MAAITRTRFEANPLLERMVALERYRALLATLRPHELAVVALRMEGLEYAGIAEILGLGSEATATMRVTEARRRLMVEFPDLRRRWDRGSDGRRG